jgi:hypothetical protein
MEAEIINPLDAATSSDIIRVMEFIRGLNDNRLFPSRKDIYSQFKDSISTRHYVNRIIEYLLHRNYIIALGSKRQYQFLVTTKGTDYLQSTAREAIKRQLKVILKERIECL